MVSDKTKSYRWQNFLWKCLNEIEFVVCSLAITALVCVLTLTIFFRYGIGSSSPWSEEVARFLFITVIFSSISYAARQHRHIRVTLFLDKFTSKKTRDFIFNTGDIVWVAFNIVVIYGAYLLLEDMFKYPEGSAVLNIPMYYIYGLIPFFYFLLTIRVIQGIILRRKGELHVSVLEEE